MKMGRRGMGHQVILIGKMLKCLSCFRQRWAYEQSCSTFKLKSRVESFPAELLCFALFLKLRIEIEMDVFELGLLSSTLILSCIERRSDPKRLFQAAIPRIG
uniref:Uncharacterized protein n=1 Tax=Cucumis sativus TaxID=3659 RepID=A0A0A0KSN8_CUCSA